MGEAQDDKEVRTVLPTLTLLATSCLERIGSAFDLSWGSLEGRIAAGYRRVHCSVANAATSPIG